MSRYLVDRIARTFEYRGRDRGADQRPWKAATACWTQSAGIEAGRETVRRAIRHLFLFIGAVPSSDWLSGFVRLDPKGFVLTGSDVAPGTPLLQTSRRGVFAVGDVRSGSVKRVGAAIGEGAQVVAAVHTFLAAPRP